MHIISTAIIYDCLMLACCFSIDSPLDSSPFFLITHFSCMSNVDFSSAPELKLINSPFFVILLFMWFFQFTYIFHDNISLMVSHNTFIFCGTNYWSIYIIIYSRWINFCILVYIGIFITNSYCFSPRNYLECLT